MPHFQTAKSPINELLSLCLGGKLQFLKHSLKEKSSGHTNTHGEFYFYVTEINSHPKISLTTHFLHSLQAVGLQYWRGRLCSSDFSSEIKPFTPDRTESEL